MKDIDASEKQFSDDLETIRIEFTDKLNIIIDKFLKAKFGDVLGGKLSKDSQVVISMEVKFKR